MILQGLHLIRPNTENIFSYWLWNTPRKINNIRNLRFSSPFEAEDNKKALYIFTQYIKDSNVEDIHGKSSNKPIDDKQKDASIN